MPSLVDPGRAVGALLLVMVAAGALAGCGTESSEPSAGAPPASPSRSLSGPSPAPQQSADRVIRLSYGNGQVSGDTGRVEVPLGSTVALVVTGATADEVHVHGYDLLLDVPAKNTARLTFTADIPGVFEVELHDAGTVLTRLAVR